MNDRNPHFCPGWWIIPSLILSVALLFWLAKCAGHLMMEICCG